MASLEGIRMVADAMAHPERGINAVLADVPRDADDEAPPLVGAIVDSTRCGWAARGQAPRDLPQNPTIAVTPADPAMLDPAARTTAQASRVADGEESIAVQYIAKAARTELGATAKLYTLRAIEGALFLFAARPATERQRNGVQLLQLTGLRRLVYEERDDTGCTGLVIATWTTRATTPLRSPLAPA